MSDKEEVAEVEAEVEQPDPPPDEVLVVKLVRKHRKIHLYDEDGTDLGVHTIREFVGPNRSEWQMKNNKRYQYDEAGNRYLHDLRDFQESLISQCLHDPEGKQVKLETIRPWPVTIKQDLFLICLELNAMTEKAEDQEKKGSGGKKNSGSSSAKDSD